jgi:hypothetical protein
LLTIAVSLVAGALVCELALRALPSPAMYRHTATPPLVETLYLMDQRLVPVSESVETR